MKAILFAITTLLFVACGHTTHKASPVAQVCGASARGCTGSKSCSACTNCKYCKHCAKEGGTCGVCK